MRKKIMSRMILAAVVCISLADCNHRGPGKKNIGGESSVNDTNPAVVTPPPADTSAVKTLPPSPDSNAVNPDSMGISR
jgi:hypothetical protein